MRSTFLTILASTALLVSAAEIDRDTVLEIEPKLSVAIGKPECVYNAIRDSNIDCDIDTILECFEAETNKEILDRIQQCLLSSNCISKESVDKSYLWADDCRPLEEIQEEREENRELRKRKEDKSSAESTESSTSTEESTSASAAAAEVTTSSSTSDITTTSSSSQSTSTTASAAASTTIASSTTSSSSTSTTGSTLSTSTTSSTTTTSSSSSSNSCFDYSTSLTSNCWNTKGTKTCVPATSTASSCASSMYCTTDSAGSDVCMVKDNTLTTSGVAVAIVFGSAVATFLITIFSCACRDSRAASRRKRALDAAMEADAKAASVNMGMGRSVTGGVGGISNNNYPARSRSPVASAPLLPTGRGGAGNDDTRNLLGGSRQPSPAPSAQLGQRNLTGGLMSGPSSPSSPSRSEEGAYNEARR